MPWPSRPKLKRKTSKMDKKKLQAEIIEKLKTVYDPEIPVNIYEIGLIYEINVMEEGKVHIP